MEGSTFIGQGVNQDSLCLILFRAYNIQNNQNEGLEYALCGMSHLNVDIWVFQETKVTVGIYTPESSGYSMVALEALSAHRGSITMFCRAAEQLSVEALQLYGTNIVGFQLATGGQWWYIVG